MEKLLLNEKEKAVLTVLKRKRAPLKLAEIATHLWPRNPRANSWVRNSLRRPVGAGLVKRAGRGTYRAR